MGSQATTAVSLNSVVEQSDSRNVSQHVLRAIHSAASKTGVDFTYLMQKASQESSFDPTAKATTSSATGLFQFTNQTWLHVVKEYGSQYGLGSYASQISQDSNGHLSVENGAAYQAILALRNSPQISAEMA
ncbi:MAG: transglycosylase SLT domain-containing protein, partial [Bdellovibrionales bacterium]